MGTTVRRAVLLGGLLWMAGMAQAAAPEKAALPRQLQFDFKATVQADGSVRMGSGSLPCKAAHHATSTPASVGCTNANPWCIQRSSS